MIGGSKARPARDKIADTSSSEFRGFTGELHPKTNFRVLFWRPKFLANSSAAQWRSEKTDGEWQPLRWVHGSGAVPDTTEGYLREYFRVHSGGSKVRIGGEIAKILDANHWTPSNTLGTDRWLAIGLRWGEDTAEVLTGAASLTHQSHLLCY